MAATVDYLFAFAATARAVKDHHFDAVYDAYLDDAEVRRFLEDHNPDTLGEMAERLGEPIDRGLWQPRRNSLRDKLHQLAARTPRATPPRARKSPTSANPRRSRTPPPPRQTPPPPNPLTATPSSSSP